MSSMSQGIDFNYTFKSCKMQKSQLKRMSFMSYGIYYNFTIHNFKIQGIIWSECASCPWAFITILQLILLKYKGSAEANLSQPKPMSSTSYGNYYNFTTKCYKLLRISWRKWAPCPTAVLSGLGRHSTHPWRWSHLPFRGHWPYRLRSNNIGSCSRTNEWQLSTYPQHRIPALIPHGIKASVCCLQRVSWSEWGPCPTAFTTILQ